MDLYISDLDGTLFAPDQTITSETARILNRLIGDGLQFTVATARSSVIFMKMLDSLNLNLPVIANNGVFVYDPLRKENILTNYFPRQTAAMILNLFEVNHLDTQVYTHEPEADKYRIYYKSTSHYGAAFYIDDRLSKGDQRFILTPDLQNAFIHPVINILCINDYEYLQPVCDELLKSGEVVCHFTRDIYSGAYWLEIGPLNADKKGALLFLKERLKAKRIICFGDNLNDRSMFEIADESYAVAGAHPELKDIATGIIGGNDQDGVAKFLEKRFG